MSDGGRPFRVAIPAPLLLAGTMDFTSLTVDTPASAWTGRNDGDGPAHRRWWQAVATAPSAGLVYT
jgi:formiminoglutamase